MNDFRHYIDLLEGNLRAVEVDKDQQIEELIAMVKGLKHHLARIIEAWDEPYYGDLESRIDILFDAIEPAREYMAGRSKP